VHSRSHADIKIVHLSEEDSAKELADKEKFAVQLVEGKSYTELELDFLVRTLDLSSEDAARALESAGGDLSLAIADDGGDEGQED
jgi:NACalpha-BTF3-like transcription factor